jgi:hypothetical protein
MFQFPNWKQAAGELHQRKLIHCACLDECHFAFTGDDFRKFALGNLYELCMLEYTQLMVMSATVPNISVLYLKEVFLLTPDIQIFHTCMLHPGI